MKFCGNCGAPQHLPCSSCGFENPPGFRFCGNCGASVLQEQSSILPPVPGTPQHEQKNEGERRHLTVMFCDLVDSTALSNALDPEDLRTVVTAYQNVCEKVVARYEGHIAQYLGDGILIYFGYPVAHENAAHRALSSGLGILEAVQRLSKNLEASQHPEISVRIGVHTGHVVIGDIGSTGLVQPLALGVTPNIAARLEALAEPDTMVISADTYQLIHQFFLCEDKGKHEVKGIPNPLRIYHVVHENIAKSRFEASQSGADQAPMVGRDREIKQLTELWEDTKAGQSHIVLLSGQPGVGKSRILQALMAHVAADSDAWLNLHQCSPYHKGTAFYPLAEAIKRVALQLKDDESSMEKISRLEGFLLQYGFSLHEMIPLFANIMALPLEGTNYQTTPFSTEQQRQKITGAFIHMYLERSREQNLLLVFEDIQWMDPSSLEVITHIVNQPPTLNILTVLTFRQEFIPPWHLQPHITPMPLSNLPAEAVKQIIMEIAGNKQLPHEVTEQIIQKTDGVPLFVEELTKMVLGSEMLQECNDHFELNAPVSSLSIPSTLHDSLVARLDTMSHTKELAQLGATIGREFGYGLISAASPMQEKALNACLKELVEAELLLQSGVPPKATFKFRHALIRDVAYQSLLKSQQQRFHKCVAESLTQKLPALAEERPEIVAYHFEKAGLLGHAVVYWTQAGDKIRQHLAYDETLNYIQRGLTLLERIGNEEDRSKLELKLLSIQAPVLIMTEGFSSSAAYQASCRMKELAEKQEDAMSLFQALRGVITYELFVGKAKVALHYAREALTIAKSLQVNEALVEAYRLVGRTSIYVGKLTLSLESFDKSISLYKSANGHAVSQLIGSDPEIFSLIQSSHVLWYLGYPDQALGRAKQALEKADEIQRPYSQVLCQFINTVVSYCCGRVQDISEHAQSCIALSEEYGVSMFSNEARVFLGAAMIENDEVEEGFRIMHESIEQRIKRNLLTGIHLHMSTLMVTCLKTGKIADGLQAADKAIALIKQSDDQLFLSEIYRLKGELLLVKGGKVGMGEVEGYLDKSIQITRKQKARSLELRSVMSMANLRKLQGKTAEGLKLVSSVYNRFHEGLETRDLIEAKHVIDGLSEASSSADDIPAHQSNDIVKH